MARVIVATVKSEGGYYSPNKCASAPIRIYSDRTVEDDYLTKLGFSKRREKLSKKEFKAIRKASRMNAKEGRI